MRLLWRLYLEGMRALAGRRYHGAPPQSTEAAASRGKETKTRRTYKALKDPSAPRPAQRPAAHDKLKQGGHAESAKDLVKLDRQINTRATRRP